MNIEAIIGDYKSFFSDLLHRLDEKEIEVSGLPIVQLLYRVETFPEYEKIRDSIKPFGKEFAETIFNGRQVLTLILKEPLVLERGFTVSVIELPAPRFAHMYPSGLESVGILVGETLPEFIEKYKNRLTGIKDHGIFCQPAFITFENDKTVKFYDRSLEAIIRLQGWQFTRIS